MKNLLLIAVLGCACCDSLHASLSGDTLELNYLYPTAVSVLYSTSGTAPLNWSLYGGTINFLLTTSEITVSVIAPNTDAWTPAPFNGFMVADLSESANFTSLTLVSQTGPVNPVAPQLTFDANDLYVNFTPGSAANSNPGQVSYTFGFTTQASPVPEPTTIISGALMLLPFGSGAFRQLRKKFQT